MTEHPPAVRTANQIRIISPDFARGLMLLGIALANVGTAWVANTQADLATSLGGIYDDSLPDKLAVVLGTMFVHVRGLAMFSTLLGFGVGMIVMSLSRRNYPLGSARGVILRRYGLLALFGALHAVFLFFGDIMYFYGLCGMVLALLITFRDKTLLWIAGIAQGLVLLFSVLGAVFAFVSPETGGLLTGSGVVMEAPGSYLAVLGTGAMMIGLTTLGFVFQALMFMPVMLFGFVLARRGVLIDVHSHRRLLWTLVGVGAAVVLLIGLPWGLAEIGVLPTSLAAGLQMLNSGFGLLTGPAFIAAVALAAQPLQERLNRSRAAGEPTRLPVGVRAVNALGKRSMSGYLLQSLFFFLLVMPFTLNLGAELGAFGLSLIATGVWLATLLIAWALEAAGKPGPFEQLHRRLSYGRTGLREQWRPAEAQAGVQPGMHPGVQQFPPQAAEHSRSAPGGDTSVGDGPR